MNGKTKKLAVFISELKVDSRPVFMGKSALVFAEGAGVDPRKRTRAALVALLESCASKLQLIVARHPDKRAPAKNPFESSPEPANQAALLCLCGPDACAFLGFRTLTCR